MILDLADLHLLEFHREGARAIRGGLEHAERGLEITHYPWYVLMP